MSKTKLTLSVDADVVERAKTFAAGHQTSVSALVERFLGGLGAGREEGADTPLVARLRGSSRPSGGREEHRRLLEEKHAR